MDCQNIVSTTAYDLYKLSNDPSPPSPPPAPCDVCLTEAACRTAVNALGLDEGGAGSAFASSTYSTKGCYAYSSGSYAGMAFWSAGTYAQMTATLSGSAYRVSCPQQCQEPPAAQPAPPPQAYSFELVHDGGECGSSDAGLPTSDSVEECAEHCAAANGCEFFSYNTGNRYCFHEFTASRDCPEGFEVDSYDFYALVPAGFSPPPPFAPAGFSINIVVQLPANGDVTMSGQDVAASLGSLTLNADVSMVVRQAWTIAVFIEGTAEEAVASVLQACQQVSADCTVCDLSDASCTASTGIGARRALEAAPRHAPPRRVLSGEPSRPEAPPGAGRSTCPRDWQTYTCQRSSRCE